jgi:integrase
VSKPIPLPRLHKTSGRAYVYHAGRYHYFGKYGTPQADERYWKWRTSLVGGKPTAAVASCLVTELFQFYRTAHPDQSVSGAVRSALNVLTEALGSLGGLTTGEYGPLAFQEHRNHLLSTGTRCARQVNDLMQFVQRIFRWGVSKQLASLETWQALKTVERLKPHQSTKKTTRRKPVAASVVAATLPYLSEHCADMVRLIVATGARPGEILSLRAEEIVKQYQARPGWWYAEKTRHKTAARGKRRWLEFPPEVHEVLLRNWPGACGFFFPIRCPRKGRELHYQVSSLRRAIRRACQRAKLAPWCPYAIRHAVITARAAQEGIGAAATLAGHDAEVTQSVYLHEPPRRTG